MGYHGQDVNQARVSVFMRSIFSVLVLACCCLARANADVSVVTTVKPLQFIATAIVGERGQVQALIDSNDSAHHFSLTPADRLAINRADILLWIDPSFEIYLADLFASQAQRRSVITTATLADMSLQHFAGGQLDPHLWLDPANALIIATALSQRLQQLDPAGAADYRQALTAFGQALAAEQTSIQQAFAGHSPDDEAGTESSYFVYHDAYRYFERVAGIGNAGAFVTDPEQEPSMSELLRLRKAVTAAAPICVLLEPDSSLPLVGSIVQDSPARRIEIDVLGNAIAPAPDSYQQLLGAVRAGFQACLGTDNNKP